MVWSSLSSHSSSFGAQKRTLQCERSELLTKQQRDRPLEEVEKVLMRNKTATSRKKWSKKNYGNLVNSTAGCDLQSSHFSYCCSFFFLFRLFHPARSTCFSFVPSSAWWWLYVFSSRVFFITKLKPPSHSRSSNFRVFTFCGNDAGVFFYFCESFSMFCAHWAAQCR